MAVAITRIPADADALRAAGWKPDEGDVRVYTADPLGVDEPGFVPYVVVSKVKDSILVAAADPDYTIGSSTADMLARIIAAAEGDHSPDEFLASIGFDDVTAA